MTVHAWHAQVNLDGFALPVRRLQGGNESIDLSSKRLGPASAAVIGALVGVNEALTSIDLTGNKLGDEGAEAIAAALKENKESKLATLVMGSNNISPRGAAALASVIAVSEALTSIDVSANSIGKEAALGLVTIFKEKDRMTSVGLGGCKLDAEGARAVADYLRVSEALTQVLTFVLSTLDPTRVTHTSQPSAAGPLVEPAVRRVARVRHLRQGDGHVHRRGDHRDRRRAACQRGADQNRVRCPKFGCQNPNPAIEAPCRLPSLV